MDFDVFRKNVMDEMRERFPNLELRVRFGRLLRTCRSLTGMSSVTMSR